MKAVFKPLGASLAALTLLSCPNGLALRPLRLLLMLALLAHAMMIPVLLSPGDPAALTGSAPLAALPAEPELSDPDQGHGPSRLRSASVAEIKQAVADAVAQNYALVPDRRGETRHQLGQRLRAQASANHVRPAIVVLAFEGTGNFAPRMVPVMQAAAARLEGKGLSARGSAMTLQYAAFKRLTAITGQEPNWSGLATGPLESLLQDPELRAATLWLSFPSEEYEVMAKLTGLKQVPLAQVGAMLLGSSPPATPGIDMAQAELREILASSGERPPLLVIAAHSSGSRSAVKFLEHAAEIRDVQGRPLRFPLALSVDPVAEAHLVMSEALTSLRRHWTGRALNRLRAWLDALPLISLPQARLAAPRVRHRDKPVGLYAPANVDAFLNFYQQQDTEGLRVAPRFGIHGSSVTGARNLEITALGREGHGQISFHPRVTASFVAALKALLARTEPEGQRP